MAGYLRAAVEGVWCPVTSPETPCQVGTVPWRGIEVSLRHCQCTAELGSYHKTWGGTFLDNLLCKDNSRRWNIGIFGEFQEPTEFRKQPIRARYLGHVTGYQPIMDQYFLIRSVPAVSCYKTSCRGVEIGSP